MARSPYPGFSALNNRRGELIHKKHLGGGLSQDQERELAMLQGVTGLMLEYKHPLGPAMDRLEKIERRVRRLMERIRKGKK